MIEMPIVSVRRDLSSIGEICSGTLQPPNVEGSSPPCNVVMLPVASDTTKGGRPEVVSVYETRLYDNSMSNGSVHKDTSDDYYCTLVPAVLSIPG